MNSRALLLPLVVGLMGCFSSVDEMPEPVEHRPIATMCDNVRDMPPISPDGGDGCTSHADCTDGANGRCIQGRGTFCTYDGCFQDSDCSGPCVCGEGTVQANYCAGGGCQVDADCGPGGWCSPTFGGCGPYGGVTAYECHTPDDACTDDADCAALGENAYCKFSTETSRWVCDNVICVG